MAGAFSGDRGRFVLELCFSLLVGGGGEAEREEESETSVSSASSSFSSGITDSTSNPATRGNLG